jgi:hypothetical protein
MDVKRMLRSNFQGGGVGCRSPIRGGRGYPSLRMDFTSLTGQLSSAGITRTFPPAPISACERTSPHRRWARPRAQSLASSRG